MLGEAERSFRGACSTLLLVLKVVGLRGPEHSQPAAVRKPRGIQIVGFVDMLEALEFPAIPERIADVLQAKEAGLPANKYADRDVANQAVLIGSAIEAAVAI